MTETLGLALLAAAVFANVAGAVYAWWSWRKAEAERDALRERRDALR